jgi:hypothetical protein
VGLFHQPVRYKLGTLHLIHIGTPNTLLVHYYFRNRCEVAVALYKYLHAEYFVGVLFTFRSRFYHTQRSILTRLNIIMTFL